MKTKEFFNHDHASAYLNGSLVRYQGEVCFVDGVGGSKKAGFKINLAELVSGSLKFSDVLLTDDRLDLNSPPLGFVNISGSKGISFVVRAMRVPSRTWKIGLTASTLFVDVLDREVDKPVAGSSGLFHHTSLKKTIVGDFPSFDESRLFVAKNLNSSMAFSRRFALKSNGNLYHIFHPSPVGTFKASGEVEFLPTFKFLKESLDRTLSK